MRPNLVRTELEQLTDIFRALGEPLRLDIIRRMSEVDELACTVLEDELPISKSTISYHMKLLYNAGLIEIRKDGRYYHYRLRRDLVNYYLGRFLEDVDTQPAARAEQTGTSTRRRGRSSARSAEKQARPAGRAAAGRA
jgi:ArsR family transcriptional regulator, arsenate/arsenite/antimonite-responsive transcriptional repressor